MRNLWAAAVAVVATIATGSIALAQTAMSSDAMAGTPTMICREAMKTDTPNATMGTTGLMCKTYDFTKAQANFMKMMQDMSATGAPTQAQINAAYHKAYGDMSLLGKPQ